VVFLEIKRLRKRFGTLEVLKGIDLSLEKGGFLVLIGPSGCGKSTLLGTIAGLESISAGEIRIEGQQINFGSQRRLSDIDRNSTVQFIALTLENRMIFHLHHNIQIA